MKEMSPDMKLIVLANTESKAVELNVYISQGSAATDLRRGVSFNSSFLRRSFLNLTVKKYEIGSLLPKISKKVAYFLIYKIYFFSETRCVYVCVFRTMS